MTNKEKNASIEYILAQGLVTPPTFWGQIKKMHRIISWKFIFWDLSYSFIFVAVTLFGVSFLSHYTAGYQYSAALGFSPVLFLLIMLFAEMNERACGLYELKQTCRYTSRLITALRSIYYSLAGAMFAIAITVFATENMVSFLRVLPVSLGGLFLCATVSLLVIRLSRSKWTIAIFGIVWICINLAFPFTFGENWELFLSGLPLAFTIAFAVMGVSGFIYQTNKMFSEEKQYAIA